MEQLKNKEGYTDYIPCVVINRLDAEEAIKDRHERRERLAGVLTDAIKEFCKEYGFDLLKSKINLMDSETGKKQFIFFDEYLGPEVSDKE